MSIAGFSLGCAFSVKWVGLFIIALVGLRTLRDLWDLLGDLRNTKVCLQVAINYGNHLVSHNITSSILTIQFIVNTIQLILMGGLCLWQSQARHNFLMIYILEN